MGEVSVYYVPNDQETWSGRSNELADRLWDYGVFLETPGVMERLRMYRDKAKPLPECTLDIHQRFGGMGIADEPEDHPVPNQLWEIRCPTCGADLADAAYDAWESESDLAPKHRTVTCPTCNVTYATKDLQYGEPMSFARFYVFVADCEQDNWDPEFRRLLEKILGQCHEYWEWST